MLVSGLLTAAYFIFGHKRRSVYLTVDPDTVPSVEDALPLMAGLTNAELYHGNAIEVFKNNEMLNEIFNSIEGARTSVHFETYVWESGELEKKIVALFCKKAREGVKVRVLIDAVGGMYADENALEKMRRSGVELAQYRRINWLNIRRFNSRTHRKILVIDGEIGLTFGHGIADEWRGHAQDADHWRDTGVRIKGGAVRPLQSIFLEDWMEARGSIPVQKSCFPDIEPQGDASVHVVSSTGTTQSSVALLYKLAIASAQREIIIQNPYFTPDPAVPQLLCEMAKRGIAVHLMVPGEQTDSRLVRRASFNLYGMMLESGVHLYEFKPTLLHQKIVIIDGKWSHVGSTNFDERSLALNAEIGVGIHDESVAGTLKSHFETDLKRSHKVSPEEWRQRPMSERVMDWCAYRLHGQI